VASRGSGRLRHLLAAVALLSAAAAPAAVEPVSIDTLALEMDPLDGEVLFRKDKNDTSRFPVAIVMPDGARLKGTISTKGGFTQGFPKKPLMIRLDKGQQWNGESRFALNAMSVDRSKMREWMAWDLIHALGMTAPKTRYMFVTLNGQDKGLFFWIEWIDPDLYDRFGFGKKVLMYDPVDKISCADLSPASVANPKKCWENIVPGGDFAPLKQLVAELDREPVDTFHQYLDRAFDAESVINFIAVTIVTANTTTYNDEYFLIYSHAREKWFVIPWAYDRSFGWAYEPTVQEPEASDNENFQYSYPLELGPPNPLRDKVFMNAVLRERLLQRLRELVAGQPDAARPWGGWLTAGQMEDRIERVRAAIAPYVARDPFLKGLETEMREKQGALQHYVQRRVEFMKRLLLPGGDGLRDIALARLPAPQASTSLIDGWGYLMADVVVRRRAAEGTLQAAVWRGAPELVPPGVDRAACVQRTWFLTAQAQAAADVTVEYLDESITASELGPVIKDEAQLQLYLRDERGWWRLPTAVNPLANTLRAPELPLPRGERQRLVACAGIPDGTVAGAAP
jgi:hypothetical protein